MKRIAICALLWITGSLVLLILKATIYSGMFGTSVLTQIENMGEGEIYGTILLALIGTTVQILYIKVNYLGSLAVASFLIGLITSILVLITAPWLYSLVFDKSFPKTIVDWEMTLTITPFLFIFCSIIAGVCFAAIQDK